jgi:Spy/CpxP family protein refolding chaperone
MIMKKLFTLVLLALAVLYFSPAANAGTFHAPLAKHKHHKHHNGAHQNAHKHLHGHRHGKAQV